VSEHKFNPVVRYLAQNLGVKIARDEVKSMRRKAHGEAVLSYFEKRPRKIGRLIDGGWIIRGMRKERDKERKNESLFSGLSWGEADQTRSLSNASGGG